MGELGFGFRLRRTNRGGYEAVFEGFCMMGLYLSFGAIAETAPLAICLAIESKKNKGEKGMNLSQVCGLKDGDLVEFMGLLPSFTTGKKYRVYKTTFGAHIFDDNSVANLLCLETHFSLVKPDLELKKINAMEMLKVMLGDKFYKDMLSNLTFAERKEFEALLLRNFKRSMEMLRKCLPKEL